MSLADELSKLDELRTRGVLTTEEFERAKARMLQGDPAVTLTNTPTASPAIQAINKLRRSTSDRWIGGVCGGLARATGAESWVWRLVFALLALMGGAGVLLYILLWVIVPVE
ncbi:PspC domain-containing protein [Piscinibacter sp.]|uniref:PspC domain-containing protein n=1 Tax=Piscinibacter sp. TaxID=1903157 RepID=UPI002B7D3F3B|nr:PspC domain-containing protein [Albitalea sp.]HUG26502.1 PspC domain-containing protein [Albitalea sp.]